MIDWHPLRPTEWDRLQTFRCAEAPDRDSAGRPVMSDLLRAQLVAQNGIHQIQVPLPRNERCLVATEGDQLLAVCWWIETGGPSRVKLLVGAVSLLARGRGLQLGDQMMGHLRDELLGWAQGSGAERVTAMGLIHGKMKRPRFDAAPV